LNNGNGTFVDGTREAVLEYVGGSDTAAFGDYDLDGDLDLYVITYRPSALQYERTSLPLQRVNGELVVPPELADRIEIVGGRLREHGEDDLMYENRGDGTFREVLDELRLEGHGWGLSGLWADADGDRWPELYVGNDLWSPDRYYDNDAGSLELMTPASLQHSPMFSMGVDFGDVNNDGELDLFIGDMLSRQHEKRSSQHGMTDEGPMAAPEPMDVPQVMRNTLHLSNGDGTYREVAWLADVAATEWTWSAKLVDIDMDGWLDLLITNGMLRDLMDSDYTERAKELNRTADRDTVLNFLNQYPPLLTRDLAFRNRGDLRFEDVSSAWGFESPAVGHGLAVADFDADGDPTWWSIA
jgi:hypothetical protein